MNWKTLVQDVFYIDGVFDKDKLVQNWYDIFHGKWEYKNMSGNKGDFNRFWLQELSEKHKDFFKVVTDNTIIRSYANGQTLTQYSSFHADDGDWTYLIYCDPHWTQEDGGGTEFKIDDNNTVVVYPIFNRVVKFRAGISHRALPNIKQGSFRVTVALKTNES